MKKLIILAAGAVIVVTACVTKNPNAVQNPQTGVWSQPPFIADTNATGKLNSLSNTLQQIANAVAPANPYASLTDTGIHWGGALAGMLIGGISGIVATLRNRNAVIASTADSIVKAGAGAAVLAHASDTPHFATIASAINDSTGANQDHTGAPTKT